MPVLYGIFLFMGVSSLGGLQFFERILIVFMPLKHQPDRPYLRRVRPKRVYLFTFFQAVGFIILYVFKHFEVRIICGNFQKLSFTKATNFTPLEEEMQWKRASALLNGSSLDPKRIEARDFILSLPIYGALAK